MTRQRERLEQASVGNLRLATRELFRGPLL